MALSSIERVRTTLVELLVVRCMTKVLLVMMFASSKMSPTAIISRKVCSSWHCHSSILRLVRQSPHCGVLYMTISAISSGSARMCVCVSPPISTTRTISGLLLAIWSIISIQHLEKWAPFMALRALSSTVPLSEWTKMTWVHQSLIRRHFHSCLPSTRGRCLRRV